jgi:hypothetical protein
MKKRKKRGPRNSRRRGGDGMKNGNTTVYE